MAVLASDRPPGPGQSRAGVASMDDQLQSSPAAGPPPPAAAVERLSAQRIPLAAFRVAELHELHPILANIAGPARDGLMPLTVVSAGRLSGSSQPHAVMHSGPGLRGLFSGWLRSLTGDGWATGTSGAELGSTAKPSNMEGLSVEMWGGQCVSGAWQVLPAVGGKTASSVWPRDFITRDGVVVGANRQGISSVHAGVELLESMVDGVRADASFVAVGVDVRRYVAELGCTFLTSAIWIDIGVRELVEEGPGFRSIQGFVEDCQATVTRPARGGAYEALRAHPMLSLLSPALNGERALAVVVIGPRGAEDGDLVVQNAAVLAEALSTHIPSASPMRLAEATSIREGFARGSSGGASSVGAIESFGVFARGLHELRAPDSMPMQEFLRGDVLVTACGFPARLLPSLNPYMSRFMITATDRRTLNAAAQREIAEFEENGWIAAGPRDGEFHPPAALFVQLADCYSLPEANLFTTMVRSYARSQDQADPIVRTIRRIREDVALVVALLPLSATHPFNPIRILRLGGIHSLLSLLSDSSSLAPNHEQAVLAVDVPLSPAEIAALALAAFAAYAPIRKFLISQSLLELLAVAIRHPASDRHLLIFAALLVRLCQDPEHRRLAADAVSAALAEQIPKIISRGTGGELAEALLAAAASLSPFLPTSVFAPVLQRLLGHLSASAAPAFHHFAYALASSLQRSSDLDLGSFVPRLLSLVPIDAPDGALFHGGAASLLALCSHTAATTSLSRRWVAAAATAIVRQALRSGPAGLAAIRTILPLAAAQKAGDGDQKARQSQEWYSEVEETTTMQATLRWTNGGGFGTKAFSGFSFSGSLGGSACLSSSLKPPATPPPALRDQCLHGWTQLVKISDLAESPNSALFHERPQLRLIVRSERTEVFMSISLLPGTHCNPPIAACGCSWDKHNEGCSGQLGLWLGEFVEHESPSSDKHEHLSGPTPLTEARYRRHQLDLRPPIHASAAMPCQTEHFVSVTLARGTYTLVPFSSHIISTDAPTAARARCRGLGCGCLDLNLKQRELWDRCSRFVSMSVWAECTDIEVVKALPNHLRLVVDGELLAQSVPLWLHVPPGGVPTEILLCVSCDSEDPTALHGSEPCLDLWPVVTHRRVRNERTGALRIYIPELKAGEPVRVTSLWQESIDPTQWRRKALRLLIYSSSPLLVHTPPPCPMYPAIGALRGSRSTAAAPAGLQPHHWQASLLLSGGWTPGFSSGFGNLRNPQVVIDVPRSPGRAEELQLDFYLSIPLQSGGRDSKRPSIALTIFALMEQQSRIHGAPERLLEGQLRKELGASKAAIGGYVTAQIVLSGAEARQPLFVVLQNSQPQEVMPWQLRILARIRSCQDAPTSELGANQACTQLDVDGPSHIYEAEVPEDPPIRCAVVGGTTAANRIYACWPENIALYIPKPARGELPTGSNERVVSWVPSRRAWGKGELLGIDSSLGPSFKPLSVVSEPPVPVADPWPPWEPLFLPDDDIATCKVAAASPGMILAGPPKAPILGREGCVKPNILYDPGESGKKEESRQHALAIGVPAPPGRRMPPRMPLAESHPSSPDQAVAPTAVADPVPPEVRSVGSDPHAARARAVRSAVRGTSEPRHLRREVLQSKAEKSAVPEPSEHKAGAQTERHARVEALLHRRRRHGYGQDSPGEDTGLQASSLPPPRDRGVLSGAGRASSIERGRRPVMEKMNPLGEAPRYSRPSSPDPLDAGTVSAGISLPPPAALASPRGGAGSSRELRRRPSGSGSASGQDESTPVVLPMLRPAAGQSPRQGSSLADAGEKTSKCCHFSGHPVFCCRAEAQRGKSTLQHIVRLERRPGADRFGFGNVSAGPKDAPVLVISWIREGALDMWNAEALDGMKVPPQSAIVAVNGVSGDVQAMREQLREQVVELQVIAPDRWKWAQVTNIA